MAAPPLHTGWGSVSALLAATGTGTGGGDVFWTGVFSPPGKARRVVGARSSLVCTDQIVDWNRARVLSYRFGVFAGPGTGFALLAPSSPFAGLTVLGAGFSAGNNYEPEEFGFRTLLDCFMFYGRCVDTQWRPGLDVAEDEGVLACIGAAQDSGQPLNRQRVTVTLEGVDLADPGEGTRPWRLR